MVSVDRARFYILLKIRTVQKYFFKTQSFCQGGHQDFHVLCFNGAQNNSPSLHWSRHHLQYNAQEQGLFLWLQTENM